MTCGNGLDLGTGRPFSTGLEALLTRRSVHLHVKRTSLVTSVGRDPPLGFAELLAHRLFGEAARRDVSATLDEVFGWLAVEVTLVVPLRVELVDLAPTCVVRPGYPEPRPGLAGHPGP